MKLHINDGSKKSLETVSSEVIGPCPGAINKCSKS